MPSILVRVDAKSPSWTVNLSQLDEFYLFHHFEERATHTHASTEIPDPAELSVVQGLKDTESLSSRMDAHRVPSSKHPLLTTRPTSNPNEVDVWFQSGRTKILENIWWSLANSRPH